MPVRRMEATCNGPVRWSSATDRTPQRPPAVVAVGRNPRLVNERCIASRCASLPPKKCNITKTSRLPNILSDSSNSGLDIYYLPDDINEGTTIFTIAAGQPVSGLTKLNGNTWILLEVHNNAERFDPREGFWARLPRMTERRGCLSLAVINQQLYAVGGFDGEKMVPGVEIFDLRFPSWIPGMPMRKPRDYAAAAMIDDTFYMMGGLSNRTEVTEIVECFNPRIGWYTSGFKSLGKRCFSSAAVM